MKDNDLRDIAYKVAGEFQTESYFEAFTITTSSHSPALISRVTARVMNSVNEWQ